MTMCLSTWSFFFWLVLRYSYCISLYRDKIVSMFDIWKKLRAAVAAHRVLFVTALVVVPVLAVFSVALVQSRHAGVARSVSPNTASANLDDDTDSGCDFDAWWDFLTVFGFDICAADTSGGSNSGGTGGGDSWWDDDPYDGVSNGNNQNGGNNGTTGGTSGGVNNLWGGITCPAGYVRTTGGSCMDQNICLGPDAASYTECGVVSVTSGGDPVSTNGGSAGTVNCPSGWHWSFFEQQCKANNDNSTWPNPTPTSAGGYVDPTACPDGYYWNMPAERCLPSPLATPTPTLLDPCPGDDWELSADGYCYDVSVSRLPTPTPAAWINGSCREVDVWNNNAVCQNRPIDMDCVENGQLTYCPGVTPIPTPEPVEEDVPWWKVWSWF